jgi:lipoprotein YgeR
MFSYYYRILIIGWVSVAIFFSACASTPPKTSSSASSQSEVAYDKSKGTYHIVQKGETLWRISKIYNVPVEVIKEVNNVIATTIQAGERLFIPAAIAMGSVAIEAGRMTAQTIYPPNISKKYFKSGFVWPIEGRIVTRFGTIQDNVRSKGIDIETGLDQPIRASQNGRVSFVSESVKGYGKMIIVDHSYSFQTVYAYNSKNLVKNGQRVKQGDTIARTGISSRTQKPGLHFEIRKNHDPLNPEGLLR